MRFSILHLFLFLTAIFNIPAQSGNYKSHMQNGHHLLFTLDKGEGIYWDSDKKQIIVVPGVYSVSRKIVVER